MFGQIFVHLVEGKYRSATVPFLYWCFYNGNEKIIWEVKIPQFYEFPNLFPSFFTKIFFPYFLHRSLYRCFSAAMNRILFQKFLSYMNIYNFQSIQWKNAKLRNLTPINYNFEPLNWNNYLLRTGHVHLPIFRISTSAFV